MENEENSIRTSSGENIASKRSGLTKGESKPVSLFDANADWLREYDPWDLFAFFTSKMDIRTYAKENPYMYSSDYEWVEKTKKYPNGTYVRKPKKRKLQPSESDWAKTTTTRKEPEENHIIQQYLKFIRRLNEQIHGSRYKQKKLGVTYAYVVEFQKRGVAHIHALIKGVPKDISTEHLEDIWKSLHPNNGLLEIVPYDSRLGAVGYLSKYVSKGAEVNLFVPKCCP